MKRSCGILMPISSLPSPHGIGTLGAEARKFVDFLADAGQSWWQILPVGPTSYGDSPYQSFSAYAGNPYFVDLETLRADGLLTEAELRLVEAELRLPELLPLERVLVLVWVEVPRLRVCASAAGMASIVQAKMAEVISADSFIMCRFLLSPR